MSWVSNSRVQWERGEGMGKRKSGARKRNQNGRIWNANEVSYFRCLSFIVHTCRYVFMLAKLCLTLYNL